MGEFVERSIKLVSTRKALSVCFDTTCNTSINVSAFLSLFVRTDELCNCDKGDLLYETWIAKMDQFRR
jgi:hypothetical protein